LHKGKKYYSITLLPLLERILEDGVEMVTAQIPTGVRENLLALGYPTDIVGKDCHITTKDSYDRVQTFPNVRIIGCFLRTKRKFQELVIRVEPQIHKGGVFDTLRRNVGPNAGKTNWWTDVYYPNEEQGSRGILTEGWQILGLLFI
jgi:hypothetical protein